jgi:hypothetical protein
MEMSDTSIGAENPIRRSVISRLNPKIMANAMRITAMEMLTESVAIRDMTPGRLPEVLMAVRWAMKNDRFMLSSV